MQQEQIEARQLLQQDFDLQLSDQLSEEELLQLLSQRLAQIIQQGPDTFFQLMYRLDIPEHLLNTALFGGTVLDDIAALVYQRQLQKIRSRAAHKKPLNNTDPELDW